MKMHSVGFNYPTEKELNEKYGRRGKCKQCGACCEVFITCVTAQEEWMDYAKGFGTIGYYDGEAYLVIHKPCKFLTKDKKCKIHKKRHQACRQFPHSNDWVWVRVRGKCGYSFKKDDKITFNNKKSITPS